MERPAVKPASTGKVYGADERELVADTTALPWSCIGRIDARFQDASGEYTWFAGSGTLVGSRTVVTSAHVVYDPDYGFAERVTFVPGKNGSEQPFGWVLVESIILPESYAGDGDDGYDIALLILDTAIGLETGYLDVAVKPDTFFPDRVLNLTGYPDDAPTYGTLWHASGPARELDGLLIRHQIDSASGQSGAPVWYYDEQSGSRYLVGVHKGSQDQSLDGVLVDSFNIAVHINTSIYNWIRENMLEYDTTVLAEVVEGTGTAPGLLCPAAAVVLAMCLSLGALGARRRRRS